VKANSEYERQMKLARFAMGRGFTFNLIQQCLPEADNLE
jgi:regulatory protein